MTAERRAGPNVRPLNVREASRHLVKAQEYLRAARTALDAEDLDAAGGNAVLAGINAADSVSGMLQGNRWNGAHEQAAAHVKKAGPDGAAVATHLAKLVRKKTQAHYEVAALRPGEASAMVQSAERAVDVAVRVAARRRG